MSQWSRHHNFVSTHGFGLFSKNQLILPRKSGINFQGKQNISVLHDIKAIPKQNVSLVLRSPMYNTNKIDLSSC